MKHLLLVIILTLFILPIRLFSQERFIVDSLNMRLETVSHDSSKIKLLWKLSDLFQISDLKKSFEYSKSAMEIANRSKLPNLKAFSYKKMGDLLFGKGLYDRSLENYLKGKVLLEETEKNIFSIGLGHNIGAVYYRMREYDKALEYYKEALAQLNVLWGQSDSTYYSEFHISYNSIGSCYNAKGELEVAKSYFLKALEGAKKVDDKQNLGITYNNLGQLSFEMGQNEEAYQYLNLSLYNREKINDKQGMARSHLYLGGYYSHIEDFAKAIEAFQKAQVLASESRSTLTSVEAYKGLAATYRKLDKYKEALNTYMNYHQYSDSLKNEASMKEISILQMQYEFDKQEKERQVKQKRKEMIYFFVIAILFLGVIISILFYKWQKTKAKQEKVQKENIEIKYDSLNKKMATNIMFLIKKNELIKEIGSKLINMKSKLAEKNQLPVQKIIFKLNSLTEDDVWEEFELRFQEVHSQFYENLNQQFPDLSPNERRLCAFLRLNMTTKEIASITQLSPKSIDVARTRLRKKLNLTNTDANLVTFLMNI